MDEYSPQPERKPAQNRLVRPHYHGDYIRKHLLFAAVILLLTALFDKDLLLFYLYFGIVLVLLIILTGS